MALSPARPTILITLALLVLSVLAGCGGSSSGATGGSSETGKSQTSSGSEGENGSEGSNGSTNPAPGFSKKAEPASFGEEGETAERDAASLVLEQNLKARESGDYATQCATLSALAAKTVEQNTSAVSKKLTCAKTLESEAATVSPRLLENTMTEPIAALRIKGNQGYALWHGKGGKDFAMKMEQEPSGEWKVNGLLVEELP